MGFLDHQIEGAELTDPAAQRRIAVALAMAAADFADHLRGSQKMVMSATDASRRPTTR
jgi:hypothetical protein